MTSKTRLKRLPLTRLALCLALATPVLTGCRSKVETAENSTSGQQAVVTTSANAGTAKSSEAEPAVMPVTMVRSQSAVGTGATVGSGAIEVEPLDSRLTAVAPEVCIAFATWPSWKANQDSQHPVDRLVANPLVREPFERLAARAGLLVALLNVDRSGINRSGGTVDPSGLQALMEYSPEFTQTVLSSAGSGFLDVNISPVSGSLQIDAAIVLKTQAKTKQVLEQLLGSFAIQGAEAKSVTFGSIDFSSITLSSNEQVPSLLLGSLGEDLLVVALGEIAAKGVATRIEAKHTAKWLSQATEGDTSRGPTNFTYVNLEKIVQFAGVFGGDAQQLIAAGRLDEARSLILRGFKTPTGTLQRIEVTGTEALFSDASSAQLDISRLAHVPSDAAFALGTVVDLPQWYESTVKGLGRVNASNSGEFQRGMNRMANDMVGMPFDQILNAFGSQLTVAASPESDLFSGVVYSLDIKDRASVEKMSRSIIERVADASGYRAPAVREIPFGEHTINTWLPTESGFLIEPAWCVTENVLLIAHSPEALKQMLISPIATSSFVKQTGLGELASEGRLVNAGVLDVPLLLKIAYPLARAGLNQLKYEALSGLDADPHEQQLALAALETDLPPLQVVLEGMQTMQFETRLSKDRITLDVKHSLPVIDPLALASTAAIVAMPAIEVDSSGSSPHDNYLNREIGLAIHLYESTTQHLPSDIVDPNGKPLLSWRVALLPYLGAEDLYTQFRLDEPWNSLHNTALIELMPDAFKRSDQDLGAGKTSVRGIGGSRGMLGTVAGKPRDLGQIKDGTSNSAMAVVADVAMQTEWTKPGMLDAATTNPDDILGDRRSFVAILGDGAVVTIPETLDITEMGYLLTIDDGNWVELYAEETVDEELQDEFLQTYDELSVRISGGQKLTRGDSSVSPPERAIDYVRTAEDAITEPDYAPPALVPPDSDNFPK